MIFSILGHHRAISSITVLLYLNVHISCAFMSPFVKYYARFKTKPFSSKGRFKIIYHNVFSLEVIVILMSLNYGRPEELGKRLPWIKWSLSVTSSQLDVLSTQYFKTPKWNSSSPAQWSVNKATRMPDICKMYPVIRKHDSFWAVVILVRTTVSRFYELYVLLAILITIHHQNKARFGRYCIYILNSAF